MSRVIRRNAVSRNAIWPTVHVETTIVVPVLNEAANVMPLIERLKKVMSDRQTEVLFIDDSKNEETVEQVIMAQDTYGDSSFRVKVYHRLGKKNWGGLSGAVTDGLKKANSDQVIIMDGDLQHPPETIPDMIAASHAANIVVASRYIKGGSADGLDGGIRHIVSRGSTWLAKAFFPFRLRDVSDPMTGFFLVNRRQIDTTRLRPKGFKILLEIIAAHPELSVSEVPLEFAERTAGESHGSLKQGMEFFGQLLDLRFGRYVRSFNRLPKFIRFGMIGGSVFAVGMVMLTVMVEVLGISPLIANAVQLLVTFYLNYILNRHTTWSERKVSRLAIHKFVFSRGVTTVLNYALFVGLLAQNIAFTVANRSVDFTINYLAANVVSLIVIMIINFIVSDRWAFAEKKEVQELDPAAAPSFWSRVNNHMPYGLLKFLLTIGVIFYAITLNPVLATSVLLAIASLILFGQSGIEVWRMMYSFREPESIDRLRFPDPKHIEERFAIIVPARHESAVLADTLHKLATQHHPHVDIIAVICDDDAETLAVAHKVEAKEKNVQVMTFPLMGRKPNKPSQLNYVLRHISSYEYSVVGIVDAEDTVQPGLLLHIEAAFHDPEVGIVQGGVQLMNHDSSWYSLHNVLEYYRWFNSAMAFQSDNNFMPLGGNTIFVRTELLEAAGGWPETLTEDCSLGVLLSSRHQTKTVVHYEPELATREETPDSLRGLFKQRVRWNQGFFHEWRKGIWKELPGRRQRMLAEYVLLSSVIMAGISILLPLSLLTFIFLDAPVILVMIMYLPLIPSMLNVILNAVLLRDFAKAFDRKVKVRHYFLLILTQAFYQMVLSAAAFWAIVRELRGDQSWHKTAHTGKHRTVEEAGNA